MEDRGQTTSSTSEPTPSVSTYQGPSGSESMAQERTSENGVLLPSGMQVRVRPMKLREQRLFAEQRQAQSVTALFERLAQACCEDVVDPGPYPASAFEGGVFKWCDALQGDLLDVARHIRVATHGAEYTFEYQCQGCNSMQRVTIHLLDDLDVVEFAEGDRERFAAGNRFETHCAGRRVTFRLLLIKDEKRLAKFAEDSKEPMTEQLLMRLLSVEGFEEARNPHGAWRQWLSDLPLGEVTDLLHRMLEVDPGIDTEARPVCPNRRCGLTSRVDLPFATAGFFMGERPQGKTTRRRRRSRRRRGLART